VAYSTNDVKTQEKISKEIAESLPNKKQNYKVKCLGCKETSSSIWKTTCKVRPCCEDWGHEFCYQCGKYSCDMLEDLFGKWPEARENLRTISKIGADAWVAVKMHKKRENFSS
jgi:hypothetical protein